MYLADGSQVPDECVRAVDELEARWPGASFPGARGAIVAAVIETLRGDPALAAQALGAEVQPGRWWSVIAPDETLWLSSSSEREARDSMRPGDTLWREHRCEVTYSSRVAP